MSFVFELSTPSLFIVRFSRRFGGCIANSRSGQYPYRSIQVVLRLYSSPSEILTGFDVDAPCFAYDGKSSSLRDFFYLILTLLT